MHEYYKIKAAVVPLLASAGYAEIKPDTELDYCGSKHCIHALDDKRFMTLWDGEDGCGLVEYWLEDDGWVTLEPIVPEAAEKDFNNNLDLLCSVIEELL